MAEKKRLDVVLVDKGCFASRERARAAIMAGVVFIDGVRFDKPGTPVVSDSEIEVKSNPNPYVSRGGLKLEKALKSFDICLEGKVCVDVGASTGGFTDCMLQHGAQKVYAIDVGYGQLAWNLRQDPKVVCMERTNVRNLKEDAIGEKAGFVSVDVSFISLRLVLPVVKMLMSEGAELVCLIKPQFEAGREKVGKKGVVREISTHREVLVNVLEKALFLGFNLAGLDFSPIRGPEGNIEFLAYFIIKNNDCKQDIQTVIKDIDKVINESHNFIM